jgi:hypothetical protein
MSDTVSDAENCWTKFSMADKHSQGRNYSMLLADESLGQVSLTVRYEHLNR